MTRNTIAIIPARGGSKGVPQKNIKNLNGYPLIAYSIKIAEKAKIFDRIIVSTDDKKIAGISQDFGAETFKRNSSLAQDDSPMIDVVFDVINKCSKQNRRPQLIVLLQPTSPLRFVKYILECISLFEEKKPDVVMSVCNFEHNPLWSLKIEDNRLVSLFSDSMKKTSRQQLLDIYRPNGSIYVSTPQNLERTRSFFSQNTIPYLMPNEHSIDIDTEFDFELAEFILKKGNMNIV